MITDIGFADDCVLCASSAEDLQQMIDILQKITSAFGQTISTTKTKVMVVQTQQTADKLGTGGHFKLAGQVLEGVDSFKYLGSIQNDRSSLD